MRVFPADRPAQLDRGPRAERLMSSCVGAVPEHPILHVDQAGEDQLREQLRAALAVLPQTEEERVFVVHLSALHQRQPLVQPLLERPLPLGRLLIGPVRRGRRGAVGVLGRVVGAARVVPRHLAQQLIPDVQPGRDVPDRLRERQPAQLFRHQILQVQRRPRAEQAVVVVDESHHAGVDPLVIGHVRVGRVGADRLGQNLGRAAALLHQVERDLGRRPVVAPDHRLAVAVVGRSGLAVHRCRRSHHASLAARRARSGRLRWHYSRALPSTHPRGQARRAALRHPLQFAPPMSYIRVSRSS